MHLVIAAIIFLAIFLLILSIYFLLEDRRTREKQKLLIRLVWPEEENRSKKSLDFRMSGAFEKVLGRILDLRPLVRLLDEADMAVPVGRLLLYCATLGLGAFLLTTLSLGNVPAMTVSLLSGLAAPIGYVVYRRNKRARALVSQLPDAVEMISRGLRAGQALDAALQEVSRSFSPPVGAEVKRIYEEMAMGLSFEAAIRGFEQRFYRITEVRILCAALLIQRETGGNLTTILDNIAHTIRGRFTFDRQVRALSAEGRLSATILASLPVLFCLISWIIRPEYVHMLFSHPTGKKLVTGALALEAVGFALMIHLAKVKV